MTLAGSAAGPSDGAGHVLADLRDVTVVGSSAQRADGVETEITWSEAQCNRPSQTTRGSVKAPTNSSYRSSAIDRLCRKADPLPPPASITAT